MQDDSSHVALVGRQMPPAPRRAMPVVVATSPVRPGARLAATNVDHVPGAPAAGIIRVHR